MRKQWRLPESPSTVADSAVAARPPAAHAWFEKPGEIVGSRSIARRPRASGIPLAEGARRRMEDPTNTAPGLCRHCRSPVPQDAGRAEFCCRGCEVVHGLLVAEGLTRFYDLAGDEAGPADPP